MRHSKKTQLMKGHFFTMTRQAFSAGRERAQDNNQIDAQRNNATPADAPRTPDLADREAALLAVHVDGNVIRVPAADLTSEELIERLRHQCEDAAQPVVFQPHNLFDWLDDQRYQLLRIIQTLGAHARLRLGDVAREYSNPFDGIVENLVGIDDPERCIAAQRAAIEAAALFMPQDAWNIAAARIASRLREAGVTGVLPQSVRKRIAAVAEHNDADEYLDILEAALVFHDALRAEFDLDAGESALRFFQDDFYAWNGHHWERLPDRELEARVTRFLQSDGRLDVTEKVVRNVVVNLRGQVLLPNWNRPMPFWIESEQPLVVGMPRLLTFRNGMIDLDHAMDGEMPHRYPVDNRYFCTVSLPYDYEPTAVCPLWAQTLQEILPPERDGDNRIAVLQEFMGLTLFHGDTRFEAFLICAGSGANGKSTVLRTWEAMLGSDNVTHVPLDALGSEFRLEEMRGKLANIASDMKRMEKWEEGRLKELVSGEPIQVNRKFKPALTMVPTARLIFATNELPPINDKSDGIWRRMTAMPFNVQFSDDQIDRRRAERLRDELSGIFNWALQGAVRLYSQERFTACEICNQCAEEHRQHSDPFRQFVDEEVLLHPEHVVLTDALYSTYKEFCERNGRKPKGSSEFGKQVLDLGGVTKHRQSGGRRKYEYHGIGLRTPQPFTLGTAGGTRRMPGQSTSHH